MAKRSLLNSQSEARAQALLDQGELHYGASFSAYIQDQVIKAFSQHPNWTQALPVATGSLARGELCPRSDLDMIFLGPEAVVLELVQDLTAERWPLRYRVPESQEDWTQGVDVQDILAIPYARALVPEAEPLLAAQQKRLRDQGLRLWKRSLKFMRQEQKKRNERYDSVSNYLEPNLKYGPGALRDAQQAFYVLDLFFGSALTIELGQARRILSRNQSFYLELRQRLHMMGGMDILSAAEQKELAQRMGFAELAPLMQKLQRSLAQVSFIHDWVMERATVSSQRLIQVSAQPLNSLAEVLEALKADSSILMQGRVRWEVEDALLGAGLKSSAPASYKKALGRQLNQAMSISQSQEFFQALFRSRVLERLIPDLARVRGVVQHDHYHRFTVDAHLGQAIKEVLRVYSKPQSLGRLAPLVKELDAQDFRILLWTALYHDLAKGKGGDHSTKGEALVKRDFVAMGLSLRLTLEVAWMVRNHLTLSTAAFRMNSQEPSTWQRLHSLGIRGKRLLRLAVFTAVDIRATNPEAWTDWKEQLLADLVISLRSSYATRFMKFLSFVEKQKVSWPKEILKQMDPTVVEALPNAVVLEELNSLDQIRADLPVKVLRNNRGEVWVRFHRLEDRPGLFLGFVRSLFATGSRIQHSSVRTWSGVGAYDWFHVRSQKTPAQLSRLLQIVEKEMESSPIGRVPQVQFDQITLVGEDDQEWIISFRGRDQRGLLLAAAQALFNLGLTIRWARVHTWGRQVDDVFAVEKIRGQDIRQILETLAKGFECNISL